MVKSQAYYDVLTEYLTDMRTLALRSHQQLVDEGLRTLGVVKPTRRLSQYHAVHPTASSPLDSAPSARKLPSLPQPSETPRLPPPTSSTTSAMSREPARRSLPTLLPSHIPSARLRRPVLQSHAIPEPSRPVLNTPRSLNASPPPLATARAFAPAAREAGAEAKHVPYTASRRRMVPITNLPRGQPLGLMEQVVGRLVRSTHPLDHQHTQAMPPMPVVTITTFQPTSRMRYAK